MRLNKSKEALRKTKLQFGLTIVKLIRMTIWACARESSRTA